MNWTATTRQELKKRFEAITSTLTTRMSQITRGSTAPSIDNLAIGSAKEVNTVVLFFDIAGFTKRESTDLPSHLQRTLWTLNCVIPMMMHVIHDHGGYVEKNTGDGLMALFDAEDGHATAVISALDAAITCFYVLDKIVNPHLIGQGIEPVHARIGIDRGLVLISRIGVPTGSSDYPRSFLTAVGATANIACRLQQSAGVDGILIGDQVAAYVPDYRRAHLMASALTGWYYIHTGAPYTIWHYNEVRYEPFDVGAFLNVPAPPQTLSSLLGASVPTRVTPAPRFSPVELLGVRKR